MATAAALAAAGPQPALAHATLVHTSPAHGEILERPPEQLILHFDERVGLIPSSVRLYDSDAKRIDVGQVQQPFDGGIEVSVPALPDDTYTVGWRVLSEDSHPIRGAFVFSVGEPVGGGVGVAEQILDEDAESALVDWGLWLVRFLGLALILGCVGGAAVLAFVVDSHQTRTRTLWIVLGILAALLAFSSLALVALTGVKVAGLGLGDVFRYSASREVLETSFGQVWLGRAALALALAAVAVLAVRRRSPERWLVPAVFLAFTIGITPALSGHARVEGALAVLSDAVHVAAAGVWAGGLAFLALLLVEAGGDRWSLASSAVPRFSLLAVGSVIALVATGVVNGLFEVSSVSALWETTYRQLVLAKAALLLPLLALGAFNNRVSVPALKAATAGPELRRRFSRAVALELGVMIAVVGVTAALVAETPAKAEASGSGAITREGEIGPYLYTLTVDPAQVGRSEVHVYLLEATGQPAVVDEIGLAATLDDPDVGLLPLEATPAGPGHVVVAAAELPLPGDWTFQLDARRGEFDQWTTTVDIPIGKDD
jgi:copper transport protein